jgi:hypothetical protein
MREWQASLLAWAAVNAADDATPSFRVLSLDPLILLWPRLVSELEAEQLRLVGSSNVSGLLQPSRARYIDPATGATKRTASGDANARRVSHSFVLDPRSTLKLAAFFAPLRRRLAAASLGAVEALASGRGAAFALAATRAAAAADQPERISVAAAAAAAAALRGAARAAASALRSAAPELLQLQRYSAGDRYALHYDVMPAVPRAASLIVYLNTMPSGAGGETIFPLARPAVSAAGGGAAAAAIAAFDGWADSAFAAASAAGAVPLRRSRKEMWNAWMELQGLERLCAMRSGALNGTLLRVRPREGAAVLFFPSTAGWGGGSPGEPDVLALHGACAVAPGQHEKWVAQQWFAPGDS